ncbi:MAG: AAA family ATPase [Actinobacteria bacterium]|nr:AAA family ATPase [Actinomycetota bacterium]
MLATEHAVEAVAERLVGRESSVEVGRLATGLAIADKQRAIGRSLTDSQRHAIAHVFASGRGLDLTVGVAGSGKTTALDVLRAGYEGNGYRVPGTAISGQAARTLHDEAGVDSRTIASLVWRLEHRRLALLIDEAGMADDQAMLQLLAAVDVAGAKAVIVGDHRQLDAVEAGGGLEAPSTGTGPRSTSSTRTSASTNPPSVAPSSGCATARSPTPSSGTATTSGFAPRRPVMMRSTSPSPRGKPTYGPATRPSCWRGDGVTWPPSTNEPASAASEPARSPAPRSSLEASATRSAIGS